MREHRVLLLCLLTAAALAGCTSEQPAQGDTSTPTLSTYSPPTYATAPASTPPITTGPNVRPREKPPTFPASLEKNLPSAAGAFAAYWEQTIDWSYATGDSTLARRAYSPSCSDCGRFMKTFDDARANRVHFLGGRSAILRTDLQLNDHHNDATAITDVTVSVQALEAIDANGKVVESDPAVARATYRVWIRWTGSRWTVVDWKQVIRR